VQEFDFDTDSEGDEANSLPAKKQTSKQLGHLRTILTGSEPESSDSDDSGSEGGGNKAKEKTTFANMEALSRTMDTEAAKEAELDMQELQDAIAAGEMEDDNLEELDDEEGGPSEPVKVLTSEGREAEKNAGGPDVFTVQRRLRHCVRVLEDFKKLGKGRCGNVLLSAGSDAKHALITSGQEPTTYRN
jgi:ribosomal RNA methyltransferase Nop2